MKFDYTRRKINKIIKWISQRPYCIRRWYVRKRIKSRDFTVISNNCWAGKLYQYLDMPYLSPTAGLYFFADDYLKFISNLKYYLSLELEFIPAEESRHFSEINNRKHNNVPIARLDDVEIVFLHYPTKEEAKEKWDRRKQRVNYDNLIFKFSRMNGCTDEHIEIFDSLPLERKIVLNVNKKTKYRSEFFWKYNIENGEIIKDTTPFPGCINLIKLIQK